ncbi:VWA domain-containing protein [Tahibacter sp.]|uniref:vWA domain-containing protein n=1 Tax=Tahibacter sp. TaxID=2056211 RepID=UPI0028C3B08F|nr:VWA domain-containing protein [Tahibacter sp.]
MRSTRLTIAISFALTLGLAACTQKQSTLPESTAKRDETQRQQPATTPEVARLGRDDKREEHKGIRADVQAAAGAATAASADAEKDNVADAVKPVSIAPPAEPPVSISAPKPASMVAPAPVAQRNASGTLHYRASPAVAGQPTHTQPANTERYQDHADNPLQITADNPVSTFSIDVDTGSYTNVRRMLTANQLPPGDAVRAEEFLNYFDYGYTPPTTRDMPFSVTTELAAAPWNAQRKLLLVGIKGYELPQSEIPPSNLVFLIDTSGSMNSPDKLPLLRDAFKQMVPNLREQDRVSIVVYAGSAGLVLAPTPGDQRQRILDALDSLSAGGSTNGGAGIQLAYTTARQNLIKGGINRVVLATDGDFNVGTTDDEALKTLVAREREHGVALTTLGFGAGNYNEQLAEQLADIGNGNHAYIDTLAEARKVLVAEAGATLFTIAKDVKIQVEFNPAAVSEYRLIGYENRQLRREDFNNDKIDAGEIGAGHDVTALYELTLVGDGGSQVDPLRYGGGNKPANSVDAQEIAFVKLRYKKPNEDTSRLIERPLRKSELQDSASERLRFAAAVAAFADTLRGGAHLGAFDLERIATLARGARGTDSDGYREEFLKLVATARRLKGGQETPEVAVIAD